MQMKTTGLMPFNLLSWYVVFCFSKRSTLAFANFITFFEMQAKSSNTSTDHLSRRNIGMLKEGLLYFSSEIPKKRTSITPPSGTLKYSNQRAFSVGNARMYVFPISFKKPLPNVAISSFPVPSHHPNRVSVRCRSS